MHANILQQEMTLDVWGALLFARIRRQYTRFAPGGANQPAALDCKGESIAKRGPPTEHALDKNIIVRRINNPCSGSVRSLQKVNTYMPKRTQTVKEYTRIYRQLLKLQNLSEPCVVTPIVLTCHTY